MPLNSFGMSVGGDLDLFARCRYTGALAYMHTVGLQSESEQSLHGLRASERGLQIKKKIGH
jgi:hypothetical protein